MALRQETDLRNALATSWGSQFASGTLQIRTGSQPTSADDAASGSLLATINLPASPFGTASGGAIAKSGTWSATASASGTAGWARFISSDTTKNADVSVTTSGGGGNLIIDNADIVSGGTVTVSSFTYTVPAT